MLRLCALSAKEAVVTYSTLAGIIKDISQRTSYIRYKCLINEIELRSSLLTLLRVYDVFGSAGMIPQFLVQLKLTFFRTQSAPQNNLQFSQTFSEYIVLRTINTISIIGGFEGFGFRLNFCLPRI